MYMSMCLCLLTSSMALIGCFIGLNTNPPRFFFHTELNPNSGDVRVLELPDSFYEEAKVRAWFEEAGAGLVGCFLPQFD